MTIGLINVMVMEGRKKRDNVRKYIKELKERGHGHPSEELDEGKRGKMPREWIGRSRKGENEAKT
jgi:hypothetical protein